MPRKNDIQLLSLNILILFDIQAWQNTIEANCLVHSLKYSNAIRLDQLQKKEYIIQHSQCKQHGLL